MVMGRFPRTENTEYNGLRMPMYIAFIREVNGERPGTFGKPEMKHDTPRVGYQTEEYPTARVIHGPANEGVRVTTGDPETIEAFRRAAHTLGIHLAGLPAEGKVTTLKVDWSRDRTQAVLDALYTGEQLLTADQLVQVSRDLIPVLPDDAVTLKVTWSPDLIAAVVLALEDAAQSEWSDYLRSEIIAAVDEIRGYREAVEEVKAMVSKEGTVPRD